MTEPPRESVSALFLEVADLDSTSRDRRLAALAPGLAAEVRALLEVERSAGDFLAVLGNGRTRRPGSTAPETPPLAPGQAVGPYRLERPLGRGGMGVVWLATDSRLDRAVALKLFPAVGRGGDASAAMLAEARAAGSLDHPHVVAVFDVGETADGGSYLAMTYCEGGSLAERLARGRLRLDRTLRMGRQLASGLAAAHARGLVHRDVKPANVLFDAAGQVRLADFGIAASIGGSTDPNRFVGTTAYLAPERLLGAVADRRSDLWSLGVTLYEALAGRRPFDGRSPAALLFEILNRDPPPFDPALALPAEVRSLVLELLAKDPTRRPDDADQIAERLGRLRQSALRRQRSAPLPRPATPLVGRARELARASALLAEHRLVTLTGPGGTGKTRLALELAELHGARHVEGCCFVSLAPVATSDGVPNALAEALGLEERGLEAITDRVLRHLARADLLLVLDNCEHLAGMGGLVSRLLEHCASLSVLATSRAPLEVRGEHELPIPPLGLPRSDSPSAEALSRSEAAMLFAERAQAVTPDFAITDRNAADVAAICRRLDGLPLAIELAAARVRTLSPAELLARLQGSTAWLRAGEIDRPIRHRTLADALEWSYALLDPTEQRLFRALSVFAGGFEGSAAAAMLDADLATADQALESLVAKNLIGLTRRPDGSIRFELLQTVTEFARRELRAAREDADARSRHAAYQLMRAERVAAELRGPEQVERHARLREEQRNVRQALATFLESGQLVSAARLAIAMHRHWLVTSSHLREVVALLRELERRIRGEPADVGGRLHADLLMVLGSLTGLVGEPQEVPHRCYQAALELVGRLGDTDAEARALNHLGWSSLVLGRHRDAGGFSERALSLHRARDASAGIATSLVNLGWVALSFADFDLAERRFEEALAIHQRSGDVRSIAYAEGHLGTTAYARGEVKAAIARYDRIAVTLEQLDDRLVAANFASRRAVATHAALGDPELELLETELLGRVREAGHTWSLGFTLAAIGRIRLDRGDVAGAEAILGESLAVRRAGGIGSAVGESAVWLAEAIWAAGREAEAKALGASGLEQWLTVEEPLGTIEALETVARWASGPEPSLARRLLRGAIGARDRLGAKLRPRDAARWAELQARLGDLGPESDTSADLASLAREALGWLER